MDTIPQFIPYSKHAEKMVLAFQWLEDDRAEYICGDYDKGLSPEMQFVLAALDAFADEQQPAPAPRGTEEAE